MYEHDFLKSRLASQERAEHYKKIYTPGTRVLLIAMGDDPFPVENNTKGTVVMVDDIGQIHVNWDNGRSLALIPGIDTFRFLTQKECVEEKVFLDSVLDGAITRSKQTGTGEENNKDDVLHDWD